MDYFNRVTTKILDKPQLALKKAYAKALYDSLDYRPGKPKPVPYGSNAIWKRHSIRIEDLLDCEIILTRKTALSFLEEYGKKTNINKLKRNYLNGDYYEKKLGRATSTRGAKKLVFTIAEVQFLTEYGTPFEFPPVLSHLLD